MKSRAFAGVHPVVQFGYFTIVMLFTMLVSQPVLLVISFVCSVCCGMYMGGRSTRRSFFRLILPASLLICVINPLFDHAGATILFYLPDENPFTLEAAVYGLVSGCMFSSVMLWCVCLRCNMTSDRIIYLFGRAAPKLGLLLSMIIRFIPQLTAQFRRVRSAQRCFGRDAGQGSVFRRISNFAAIVSSVIGWSMEHSLITADSMKSRGYGLGRRTSFTLFRFERRDALIGAVILILAAASAAGCISGTAEFYYFPSFSPVEAGLSDIVTYISFAGLCTVPLVIDVKEGRKWTTIQ